MSQTEAQTLVSGDAATLARRYAGAFYELAESEKCLDAAAADLRVLLQIAEGNADFAAIANHPRLSRKRLVQAVGEMSSALKLNPLTEKFIALVARQRRLALLSPIIHAFLARLAKDRGEFTASVRSATAMTPQQTEQLSARLAAMAGGKVHLVVNEDKSLIGGLTVQMGSRLVDASLKNKLQRLERQLKSDAA